MATDHHADEHHNDGHHGDGHHSADPAAHVQDSDHFEVPSWLHSEGTGIVKIPQPFPESSGIVITKFMVLELVAAVIVAVLFISLARRIKDGALPRGRFWGLLEVLVVFIRDNVARPAIGKHDADKYLPLLWTMFFFVLGCNLLGMIPFAGSPTGSLAMTGAMALITFAVVVGSGLVKLGPVGFLKSLIPPMDLPIYMAVILVPLIFALELLSLIIKHGILAVRLLANMFAGHVVLVVIMGFLVATAGTSLQYIVWPVALFGGTALSLLELFVAFLQAYIFTFLSALFIGLAVHPHH